MCLNKKGFLKKYNLGRNYRSHMGGELLINQSDGLYTVLVFCSCGIGLKKHFIWE